MGRVVPFIAPKVLGAIMNDRAAYDPKAKGYSVTYRVGQTTIPQCPGCGRTQWLVGRTMAECGNCALALPLDHGTR